MMWFTFIIMVAIGLADIYLLIIKKSTISQRYHKTFPQWIDTIIMLTVLALVWIFFGVFVFTCVMAGDILGHLTWHEGA